MPSFDVRLVASPEDLPGLLVSVDGRAAPVGGVTVNGASAVAVVNRAPASLRRRQGGDELNAPWWDAVPYATPPDFDPTAFDGRGAIDFTGDQPYVLSSPGVRSGFPTTSIGGYTWVSVTDWSPSTNGFLYSAASGLMFLLDDPNNPGDLGWLDAGGFKSTGVATIGGRQLNLVRLGSGGIAARAEWRRGGVQVYQNDTAYDPIHIGGQPNVNALGGSADGGGQHFVGQLARALLFRRAVTDLEAQYLEGILGPQFVAMGAPEVWAHPATVDWTDPDQPGLVTRVHAEPGRPHRSLLITRPANTAVTVLAMAVEGAGPGAEPALSAASGYVPWYVEWPLIGGASEPPVVQDTLVPGVCKLRLATDGHYLFGMYRPGAGASFVHFDVETE